MGVSRCRAFGARASPPQHLHLHSRPLPPGAQAGGSSACARASIAEDEQAAGATATGDGSASAPKRQGFVAKLIRKIVSNVHVEIEDARASFRNANSGLACSVELGGLDVVSTDANFQPGQRDGKGRGADEVVAGDGALYKLFSLREVGFRMAAAGVSDLSDAEYVLHPVSACLRLAHEPRVGLLHTSFEVAREDILELTLVRSQVKHLRRSQVEASRRSVGGSWESRA